MPAEKTPSTETEPQIKGVALVEVVKGLRLHRDAARPILPQNLHVYLDQRIEIGAWYPEEDHIGLLRAVAELFGPPGLEAWRWMGRQRAILDLQEVFSEQLHFGDPQATLKACENLWPLYRTTGRIEAAIAAAPPHRLCLIDYSFLNAEMVRLFTGYIEAALELSGLKEYRVREPEDWVPSCAEWLVDWP